jgi:hypothetical protein
LGDSTLNYYTKFSTVLQAKNIGCHVRGKSQFGGGLNRVLEIYATDDLAGVSTLHISNDPLMQTGVTTTLYANTVNWVFGSNRIAWVVAEDAVGNRSEPYPVYAEDGLIIISGDAGVANAALIYRKDGRTQSIKTNSTGRYELWVPYGWSGIITRSRSGYQFQPANRTYQNVTEAKPDQNYVATNIRNSSEQPPVVVSIARAPNRVACNTNLIYFNVTFSKPVQGVTQEEFALTLTGSLSGRLRACMASGC